MFQDEFRSAVARNAAGIVGFLASLCYHQSMKLSENEASAIIPGFAPNIDASEVDFDRASLALDAFILLGTEAQGRDSMRNIYPILREMHKLPNIDEVVAEKIETIVELIIRE